MTMPERQTPIATARVGWGQRPAVYTEMRSL